MQIHREEPAWHVHREQRPKVKRRGADSQGRGDPLPWVQTGEELPRPRTREQAQRELRPPQQRSAVHCQPGQVTTNPCTNPQFRPELQPDGWGSDGPTPRLG